MTDEQHHLMNEAELTGVLVDVIRQTFRQPDLIFDPDQSLRNFFGADSVSFVGLILAIEERLGVLLPELEIDSIQTFGDLLDLSRAMTGGAKA